MSNYRIYYSSDSVAIACACWKTLSRLTLHAALCNETRYDSSEDESDPASQHDDEDYSFFQNSRAVIVKTCLDKEQKQF